MFKFLRRNSDSQTTINPETTRESLSRLVADLNQVIEGMSEKPSVSVNLASSQLELVLPEQLDDEAIPLPAPKPEMKTQEMKEAA